MNLAASKAGVPADQHDAEDPLDRYRREVSELQSAYKSAIDESRRVFGAAKRAAWIAFREQRAAAVRRLREARHSGRPEDSAEKSASPAVSVKRGVKRQ
jgi:hypothetical protein